MHDCEFVCSGGSSISARDSEHGENDRYDTIMDHSHDSGLRNTLPGDSPIPLVCFLP